MTTTAPVTDTADREAHARTRALADAAAIFAKGDGAVWDALVDALTTINLAKGVASGPPANVAIMPPPSPAPPASRVVPMPPEPVTVPDLSKNLRCPECRKREGQATCPTCRGTGNVTRETFSELQARRQKRS